MSYTYLRANQTCPICGSKGWCAIDEATNLGTLRWCQRYKGGYDSEAVVKMVYGKDKEYEDHYQLKGGADGRMYVIVPTKSENGGGAFQEYDFWYATIQDKLRRFEDKNKAYCEEKGYAYKPKSSFTIDGIEKTDSNFVYVAPEKIKWTEVDIIKPLSHDILDMVLRKWLPYFTLSPWHEKKLLKEWDVTDKPYLKGVFSPDEMFGRWHLKTLPPEDKVRREAAEFYKIHTAGPTRAQLIEKLLEICKNVGLETPAGIPGIYFNDKINNWDFLSRSGIIFPVIDVNGKMYRFRIGVDTPDVNGELRGVKGTYRFYKDTWYFEREGKPREEKSIVAWRYGAKEALIQLNSKELPPGKPNAKYVNFSSFSELKDNENHTITNRFKNGCQCGNCLAVYRPTDDPPVGVWFTEGEKKSMVIAAFNKSAVVCLPGVNSYGKAFEPVEEGMMSTVESLVSEGALAAVVAFDADKAENPRVQASEDALVERLKTAGFKMVSVVDWQEEYGKGIDDLLLQGGRVDPKVVYVEGM